MTISVDYPNKLVLSSGNITDIVTFHETLRDFEDNPDGVLYPVIHTYKQVALGGGAYFPAISFINGWQLKFPSPGNYIISGGNLSATIVPVAGVFVYQTQSAAYAVTSSGGGGGATPSDIADAVWTHSVASTLQNNIQFLKDIEGGRWKITGNQMIFYKSDNVTEIARFDLKDSTGAPTMNNPMERSRV